MRRNSLSKLATFHFPFSLSLLSSNASFSSTPEEIASRAELTRTHESVGRTVAEMHANMAKAQADVLRAFETKTNSIQNIHSQVAAHEREVMELAKAMGDPNTDPDVLWGRFQKMGIEITDSGFKDTRNDALLRQLEDVSRTDNIVDLRSISNAINALAQETEEARSGVQTLMDKISDAPDIAKDVVEQHIHQEAERKGIDPKVAAQLIRDVSNRASKKL